ncbi:MAG: 1-deoxy-D-xylulose-5-phosphate reductoisomerase [Opitutaceae bacterium]|nr:1-deoxy-D-xylulose-5-phosphate reductoisomerase [Opitutaceae bacterium]
MSLRSRRRVVLLGATGSIGESALRVIAAHPDKLDLIGVASRSNVSRLAAIAAAHRVPHVAIADEAAARQAARDGVLPRDSILHAGDRGLVELATLPGADVVLVAVVGTAGLAPALAALDAGRDLALASKEILVLAGKFIMEAARKSGARLLPVDSEHAAVAQCLTGHAHSDVARVILTASGGAFRDLPLERLSQATRADALRHPNWSMGPKITVDSATLANKGLELIEAQWLFNLQPRQCEAVIHSQSIVHCLVEFVDGVMLAQLSPPSMTFPIQRALLPGSAAPGVEHALDLLRQFSLDFKPVEETRYPLYRLARETMETGGVTPAIFNAANEIAVEAFLEDRLGFLAISDVVDHTLQTVPSFEPTDLPSVLAIDAEARRVAAGHCRKPAGTRTFSPPSR